MIMKTMLMMATMILREVVKKRIFYGQADRKGWPPALLQSDFCDFFGCVKNWCSLVQKHCFKPFLVGQNFHICLRSGPRGLTPPTPIPLVPPLALTACLPKIFVFKFWICLKSWSSIAILQTVFRLLFPNLRQKTKENISPAPVVLAP